MEEALKSLRAACRAHHVAAIVGLGVGERSGARESRRGDLRCRPRAGSPDQRIKSRRAANRETTCRRQAGVFRTAGAVFGITICHEGWRYPETVRWPAVRGARIVFQPQVTGSGKQGKVLTTWGESFYEKAMQCRAAENAIYFASVNQAMRHQNSATSLIDPQGNLIASVPYGKEDLLIADLDLSKATRFYARKYKADLYPE